MNRFGLPVVDLAKCTACGDCVDICPKGLFSLHGISQQLWVACNNRAKGDVAELQCEVACTACGRCVVDAAENMITLKQDLAVIDYAQNAYATPTPTERCPTGAIVWLDDVRGALRGKGARKIVRQQALPVLSEG